MALVTNPLLHKIPFNIFIFKKILTNYAIKSVIYTKIINNFTHIIFAMHVNLTTKSSLFEIIYGNSLYKTI